eukprot:622347-Rhodomonas_salina.4
MLKAWYAARIATLLAILCLLLCADRSQSFVLLAKHHKHPNLLSNSNALQIRGAPPWRDAAGAALSDIHLERPHTACRYLRRVLYVVLPSQSSAAPHSSGYQQHPAG